MADYLVGFGGKLVLVDLNVEKVDLAVAACEALGVKARAYLFNVANELHLVDTVSKVFEDFCPHHVLFNNDGILRYVVLVKVK
ncbi:short chain dehydrogenase, partial [Pseudomonas syringae pv. tagetis]